MAGRSLAEEVGPPLGMLTRLAADKHPVISYHFPWPGLGHVAKAGEGFDWYAEPINVTTL